ncbi:hypothetical protein GCM10009113_12900 [Marinobacter szutsaonensis]
MDFRHDNHILATIGSIEGAEVGGELIAQNENEVGHDRTPVVSGYTKEVARIRQGRKGGSVRGMLD